MKSLPSGTVTFLFTDIEGSTRLAREYPNTWETSRQRHHAILQEAMNAEAGYVFQIVGDAFCVAFSTASEAIQAAAKAQNALYNENWGDAPIKVRMGIHTGKAELQDNGEYHGYLALSRVQRLMSAGSGGQTLISQTTQELVRDELPNKVYLHDLGEHRLKDLIRPDHIYQLNYEGLPVDFPSIKTLDIYQHNLPIQMTSFIGREREMIEIRQALSEHHLVTLTGPGGAGKTRLALQVAADLVDKFRDGVWLIDLAPISDPGFVPEAFAEAINLRQEGALPLIDLLTNYLRPREILFVLDNCEHLLDACAQAVDLLLHASHGLRILATSRESLGVAGEMTIPVPSLTFTNIRRPEPSTLSQYDATRLFIDRAVLVQPHFEVNNQNAPAVAQICYRLDGIPLAIELAAARVKSMSPEQIAARLDDSFRLLTGGSRTVLPRHQTLRATIDWSWALLSGSECSLLRRLSVFSGGWTLEAAEGVCSGEGIDEGEILDLLSQLVNKSLVTWNEAQSEPRYQLLETIRQYAQAKLSEAGEELQVRKKHAGYYAQFAESTISHIYSPEQASLMKRLDEEQDNLRTALEWMISNDPNHALVMAHHLGDYWFFREAYSEGGLWSKRSLDANPQSPMSLRAEVLIRSSLFAVQLGQYADAVPYASSGLALARQSQDPALLAGALFAMGTIQIETGDKNQARACLEEALPLARLTRSPFVLPGLLAYIGLVHIESGEFSQAEPFLQESTDVARQLFAIYWQPLGLMLLGGLDLLRKDTDKARADLSLGLQLARERRANLFLAHIEEMLARVQILEGDFNSARANLTETIHLLQEMSLKACLAHGLEGWARLTLALGDPQRAARLLAAIDAHLKALGGHMIPVEQALYNLTLNAVQHELGEETFNQEWALGMKLNVDEAIKLAMSWNPAS